MLRSTGIKWDLRKSQVEENLEGNYQCRLGIEDGLTWLIKSLNQLTLTPIHPTSPTMPMTWSTLTCLLVPMAIAMIGT